MYQNLRRQPNNRLRMRLERMKAVFPPVEPGVVFDGVVGRLAFENRVGMWVVENAMGGVGGEESFEREGEEVGDFGGIQFGLRGEASVLSFEAHRQVERTFNE